MAERHDTLVMLRLREITITDLGNYTCEAENTQGTARDHIELSGNFLKAQKIHKITKIPRILKITKIPKILKVAKFTKIPKFTKITRITKISKITKFAKAKFHKLLNRKIHQKSKTILFFKYVFLFFAEFMSHFCIAVGLEQFRGMLFPNKY